MLGLKLNHVSKSGPRSELQGDTPLVRRTSYPDNKVHGPHVVSMNFAIWVITNYVKSRRHEIVRKNNQIFLIFERRLVRITTEEPVKFQNDDHNNLISFIASSRLWEIWGYSALPLTESRH